jgi:hypothetical protein
VRLALESKSGRLPTGPSSPSTARDALVKKLNAEFVKQGIVLYAEISGDTLTVHSEQASGTRFDMLLVDDSIMASLEATPDRKIRRTNDADQNFAYDVKAAQVVATAQTSARLVPEPSLDQTAPEKKAVEPASTVATAPAYP